MSKIQNNRFICPESAGACPRESEMKKYEKGPADSPRSEGRYTGLSAPVADSLLAGMSYAWNVNNNGNVNNNNKNNNNRVRSVRAFAASSSDLNLFFQDADGKVELTDLFEAYFDCRKNKRKTINALAFELDYEHNLIELCNDINNGTYQISRSIAFIVNKPVKREIFAADFRDRIVHHYIVKRINPLLENYFIHDSYSCREGKGTQYGIRRLYTNIWQCSNGYRQDAYILKLDIEGFFMHIDKALLRERLTRFLEEQYFGNDKKIVIRLCRQIVDNDPTEHCVVKGGKRSWEGLPKSKSLFWVGKDKGLPIGNLTSQVFANFYLDPLDKFVTQALGVKYYGRYVDDFVLVHEDKEFLLGQIPKIARFLENHLLLKLHSKKIYFQHFSKGVKFIGAVVLPHRIYIANRTKGNCWQSISKYNEIVRDHYPSKDEIKAFQQSINSYFGFMCHYKTYNIRKKMLRHFSAYWWNHVYMKKGYVALKRKIVNRKDNTLM